MPRPHRLPRWALLALTCAAFLAIAMIPRGVVRAIEVSHVRDIAPPPADVEHVEAPSEGQVELPGVRAVVSREEQVLPFVPAALGAPVPGEPGVHDADPAPTESWGEAPPVDPQVSPAPSGSRAPPPSI